MRLGANTHIEWTHDSANLWWGCQKVSPACTNCYAETWAKRLDRVTNYDGSGERVEVKSAFKMLYKFEALAKKEGTRRRVFMNSMSDIFDNHIPDDLKASRTHLLQNILNYWPNLDFLLLTKRISFVGNIVP